MEADTDENFFRWLARFPLAADLHINSRNSSRLDHGGGKYLSLPQCSREQLEKEVSGRGLSLCRVTHMDDHAQKIQYLTVEQRLNYLVKIDPQGRLCWARNERFVDTTAKVRIIIIITRNLTPTTILIPPAPSEMERCWWWQRDNPRRRLRTTPDRCSTQGTRGQQR